MARVALVTGGTRGIGEAISIALKEAGCAVAANYGGNVERATEFSDRTGIEAYKFDVGDYEAVLGRRRPGRGRSRPDRHPGQQCRHHPGRHHAPDVVRQLGRCHPHQPFVLLQLLPGRHRRHAGAQVRPHRQHRLDQRPGRPVRPGELCCRQIRHPRLHQGAGPGRRRPGHHGQRHRARLCRYRHGARRAAEGAGADHPAHPGRPPRQRARYRPRRGFPDRRRRRLSSPARRSASTAASICTRWVPGGLRPP